MDAFAPRDRQRPRQNEERDEDEEEDGSSGSPTTTTSSSSPSSPSALFRCVDFTRTYPHCPVFVPSCGRHELERGTLALLVRDLVPFTVVVEKEEEKAYSELIDRLVYLFYGAGGFFSAESAAEAAASSAAAAGMNESSVEHEEPSSGSTVASHLQCVCCAHRPGKTSHIKKETMNEEEDEDGEGDEKGDAKTTRASAAKVGENAAASTTLESVAQEIMTALGTAYHHGYVFQPDARMSKATSAPAEKASTLSRSDRRPSEPFIITTVEQVRALFRIAVLPASRKGVSYVRNYILHVLVPQVMLACGVDDEKANQHLMHETALFGAGETTKLTPTMMASVLASEHALYRLGTSQSAATAPLDAAVAAFYTRQQEQQQQQQEGSGTASVTSPSAAAARVAPRETPMSFKQYEARRAQRMRVQRDLQHVDAPHALVGFYWVLDDDISALHKPLANAQKLSYISVREMMCEVEARILRLRANVTDKEGTTPGSPSSPAGVGGRGGMTSGAGLASSPTSSFGASSGIRPAATMTQARLTGTHIGGAIFTGREDVVANNSLSDGNGGGSFTTLGIPSFDQYPLIACYSLEYGRFAFSYDDDALGINTYNNIACLFNHRLLHDPQCPVYFPPKLLGHAVRTPQETLVGYAGQNMMWYRFAVREDYDFTLQLIARGMFTVRFRNLSFTAPQMAKSKGGMTDYYKHRTDDIERQNDRFVLQWPAVAQHWVKGKGETERKDIRVRWDLLHPSRTRYPGAYLYLSAPLPQLQPQVLPGGATMTTTTTATSDNATSPATTADVIVVDDAENVAAEAKGEAVVLSPAQRTAPAIPPSTTVARPQKVPVKAVANWMKSMPTLSAAPTAAAAPAARAATTTPSATTPSVVAAPPPPALHTPLAQPQATSPTATPTPAAQTNLTDPLTPTRKRVKTEAVVTTPATATEKPAKWKGYGVLLWRDLDPDDAGQFGLRRIPNEALAIGASVAVVPPLLTQQPSVVHGTVIEKSTDEHTGQTLWSVVASKRGMPILSVSACYEPVKDGLEQVITAVDAFFSAAQQQESEEGS